MNLNKIQRSNQRVSQDKDSFERHNYETASGNVASMREPLDGSLWWYWIAANAAKKNGASFKNYHRLSHLFYLCGVQIRQSLLCNMRDWSQG